MDACSDGSCTTVNFEEARVFQMFSDGKLTSIRLQVHPQTTLPAPAWDDPGWVPATGWETVGAGTVSGTEVTDPAELEFTPQNSRFILIEGQNDGTHGNPSYLEIRSVKLFSHLDD